MPTKYLRERKDASTVNVRNTMSSLLEAGLRREFDAEEWREKVSRAKQERSQAEARRRGKSSIFNQRTPIRPTRSGRP